MTVHMLHSDRIWRGELFPQQWRIKQRSKKNLHSDQPFRKPRWFPSFLWLFPRGKRHL